MCGIIGYIGSKPVVPVLIEGLRRMEYRGYDSAGVALVSPEGISLRRSAGKLANLEKALVDDAIERLETGTVGLRQICNGNDGGHGGLKVRTGNAGWENGTSSGSGPGEVASISR